MMNRPTNMLIQISGWSLIAAETSICSHKICSLFSQLETVKFKFELPQMMKQSQNMLTHSKTDETSYRIFETRPICFQWKEIIKVPLSFVCSRYVVDLFHFDLDFILHSFYIELFHCLIFQTKSSFYLVRFPNPLASMLLDFSSLLLPTLTNRYLDALASLVHNTK